MCNIKKSFTGLVFLAGSSNFEKGRWEVKIIVLARYCCHFIDRAIFVWPWKMVSVSVRYLFYQAMDEKIKTWALRFPAKENPNMEKALFDWPIVLQYDVKAKYRLISRKFSGMKFFQPSVRLTNQKLRAFVSVRQTNQIVLFPFACFCFVCAFSFQGHTKIALILHVNCKMKLWYAWLLRGKPIKRPFSNKHPGNFDRFVGRLKVVVHL